MSHESDAARHRKEAVRLREQIGKASSEVADRRKRAAKAGEAARKTASPTSQTSKLRDAERHTKAANDAEAKRAGLEKKLAVIEGKLAKAEAGAGRDRAATQKKALDRLRDEQRRAAKQFRPDGSEGSGGSFASTYTPSPPAAGATDVFLSHASEDKEVVARPLKEALEARDLSVWFDEVELKVGSSIRQGIEAGIAGCRFGVVVVSPHFLAKRWTQAELNGLFSRQFNDGRSLVLPIWHSITKDQVIANAPMLADILALNTSLSTIEEIADEITTVVRAADE